VVAGGLTALRPALRRQRTTRGDNQDHTGDEREYAEATEDPGQRRTKSLDLALGIVRLVDGVLRALLREGSAHVVDRHGGHRAAAGQTQADLADLLLLHVDDDAGGRLDPVARHDLVRVGQLDRVAQL